MLAGYPDPRIDSNREFPNPNPNVLEFLNQRPGFENKVAAYGTWDRLTSIVNAERTASSSSRRDGRRSRTIR